MARISKADYETVTVTCDHCGKECVFNRREDFANIGPYAGENVICSYCHREFRMIGDTINAAYELFIVEAREYFRGKRYMLAVATMGQAWELFFSVFARGRYLYRPFFLGPMEQHDLDRLNSLQSELEQALRKFTLNPLRNLLVNTVVKGVAPRTLDEAALTISQIASEDLGNDPPKMVTSSVDDPDIKEVLDRMLALSIGNLRNKVVHHRAYRPLRAEVERCLEDEVCLLYRAKGALGIRSFEELDAGLV
jgi:hypothetical protein